MKKIEIILLLMLQFIFAKNDIYREDTFLFSIYKYIDPLVIDDDFLRTQNIFLMILILLLIITLSLKTKYLILLIMTGIQLKKKFKI